MRRKALPRSASAAAWALQCAWSGSLPNGYREFCRRQHRQVAAYLAIFAWKANADFVVVERSFLEERFSLERIKSARENWFLSDVEPWFSHHERLVQGATLSSFYLARREFEDFPGQKMSNEERINLLKERGLKGMLVSQIPEVLSRRKSTYRRSEAERAAREATVIRELTNIPVGLSDLNHFKLKKPKY
jgi:hypothetical protein